MPELPEVEVVRLRLRAAVVNRRIAEVRAARANYAFLTEARLKQRLQGRRITEIERQGKYLLFFRAQSRRPNDGASYRAQLISERCICS